MEAQLAKLQAKLEADQGLAEKIFSLETPEEVQSLIKAQGIEFSLEEINTIKDALVKAATKRESSELTDEDLEDVAGGSIGSVIDGFVNNLTNFVKIGGRRW